MRNDNVLRSTYKVAGIFVVAILLLITLYPVFWMIVSSLKAPNEFSMLPFYALPKSLYFDNFRVAWTTGQMGIFFKNSMFVTLVSLLFMVLLSVPAAFAITKMKWKYSNLANTYFMLGIMIPAQAVLIPLFIIFNKLHLLNSHFGLICIYVSFGLSMSIFLFGGFFRGLPNEIMESAVIDGCDIYSLLEKILLPLMGNAIVTVLTLEFLFTWNDLIFAMTFLSKTDLKTVQLGLMLFTSEHGQREWGPTFASIAIGTLPTIILYLFLSKAMIKGITAGAIKG